MRTRVLAGTVGFLLLSALAPTVARAAAPTTDTASPPAATSVAPAAPTTVAAVQPALRGTPRTLARLRCSAWTFVPLATTTCTRGALDTVRVIPSGGTWYAFSTRLRTWVPTPYVWSTAHRRLQLDARRLTVAPPRSGAAVPVWRWTCSRWTLASDTGPTTCLSGSARRVVSVFGAPGSPVRSWDPTSRTYLPTPYRWNPHGGFLSLDATLVPVASVDLGGTMQPRPSPTVSDYVVRCPSGSLDVDVVARGGATVTLDGSVRSSSGKVAVGLTAGQAVRWTLALPGRPPVEQQARCLPSDFPRFTAERTGTPASEWYAFTPDLGAGVAPGADHYVVVADSHGTPVWWKGVTAYAPLDAHLLPTGEVTWSETGLLFSQVNTLHRSGLSGVEEPTFGDGLGLDHHELIPTSDGNYLGIRYVYRDCPATPSECVDMTAVGGSTTGTLIDGEIVKLSPEGTVLWTWRARDHTTFAEWADLPGTVHAAISRFDVSGRDYWDVDHVNSVEEDGDGVIVSFRHLDAVYRIRTSDGGIDWKLGGTPTPRSLTVLGLDRLPFLSSQHDARRLPNGHLSIFDNGTDAGRPPRVLEVALDLPQRSATVVRAVTDPLAPGSPCCGSSRAVPGGGWAVAWGGTGRLTETDAAGKVVLTMDYGDVFSYRVVPVAPGVVPRSDLVAGMDAMHPRSS